MKPFEWLIEAAHTKLEVLLVLKQLESEKGKEERRNAGILVGYGGVNTPTRGLGVFRLCWTGFPRLGVAAQGPGKWVDAQAWGCTLGLWRLVMGHA
ncbi:hypothetical protein PIB30_093763 [Stylosanthes scabra]|uniref:Uncharacterized protein n=1 Tax=Stylosanthes scabra TaxID=79078 RepID=A0ABU6QUQ1_9FABA|nr:hypothetical protein [Stylosanthes scabra]